MLEDANVGNRRVQREISTEMRASALKMSRSFLKTLGVSDHTVVIAETDGGTRPEIRIIAGVGRSQVVG
jgi:hypothetical protein